jgi:hypothetical protein
VHVTRYSLTYSHHLGDYKPLDFFIWEHETRDPISHNESALIFFIRKSIDACFLRWFSHELIIVNFEAEPHQKQITINNKKSCGKKTVLIRFSGCTITKETTIHTSLNTCLSIHNIYSCCSQSNRSIYIASEN